MLARQFRKTQAKTQGMLLGKSLALMELTPWVKFSALARCCKSINLTKWVRLLSTSWGKLSLSKYSSQSLKKASESWGITPGSIRKLNLTTVLTLLLLFLAFKVSNRRNRAEWGEELPPRALAVTRLSPLRSPVSFPLFTVTPTGLPMAPRIPRPGPLSPGPSPAGAGRWRPRPARPGGAQTFRASFAAGCAMGREKARLSPWGPSVGLSPCGAFGSRASPCGAWGGSAVPPLRAAAPRRCLRRADGPGRAAAGGAQGGVWPRHYLWAPAPICSANDAPAAAEPSLAGAAARAGQRL